MKALCKLIVLLLLFVLALAAMGVAAFIGIGTLLARWLPVSLFQAALLAIAATATIALVLQAFLSMMHLHMDHSDLDDVFGWDLPEEDDIPAPSPTTSPPNVGRNQPCPCGSGKKFKNCCGKSPVT
jgi:hypothetical protein